jgi:hypothetical protein
VTPPSTVSVRLPSAWIELDPRAPDLTAELERALDVRPGAPEAVSALLAPLALSLRRDAADGDIVLIGFLAQAVEVDAGAPPLVLTANVVLAVSPAVDRSAAVAALGPDVEPVDLPAGPAVLATGEVEITDPRWEGSVSARTRRYLVPVPGTDRIAVLAFQTPILDLADQFDDVFAAIAESLAFDMRTATGDPT